MIENESWQLYGSIPWSRALDFSQAILFLKIKKIISFKSDQEFMWRLDQTD